MVRVNLIEPRKLSDQHLVAEYVEILMLVGSIDEPAELKREDRSETYRLGKGHITFFKDKLKYLDRRHWEIKREMKKRGFKTNKKLQTKKFHKSLKNDWFPEDKDVKLIKKRLKEKLLKKDGWYRYYGEVKSIRFFIGLMNGKTKID